jgi:hypothetical protein
MDLHHLIRVARERRNLLAIGFGVAVALAVLAYARPTVADGRPTLEPRGSETWRSEEILFITQPGFPAGRGVPLYRPSNPARGTPAVAVDDQTRLANLAPLYAQLATGDAVRTLVTSKRPLAPDVEVAAEPITYTTTQFAYPQVLPLISLNATADSSAKAIGAVKRFSAAFRSYVLRQQNAAGIPDRDRVFVRVLDEAKASEAALIAGRSKIAPLLIFFVVSMLVIGIALVLDNLAQAYRLQEIEHDVAAQEDASPSAAAVRRKRRARAAVGEMAARSARRRTTEP